MEVVEDKEHEEFIVKAKGFPYDTTPVELAIFFAGCDIADGKHKGIHFIQTEGSKKGRTEAFLELMCEDDVERALQLNKKYIRDRYVEVSRSTKDEMEIALENSNDTGDVGVSCVIKVTGLPFTALPEEIATFFAGSDIKGGKKNGVDFIRNDDGSPSGICFVEFLTSEDVQLALAKDKKYLGNRFCHVLKSSVTERDAALEKQKEALSNITEPIVKLRGLPYKAMESEIREFFPDLEIISFEMVLNDLGNCAGEAFLEFASIHDAKEALKYFKIKYLHRCVDVMKSSKAEWLSEIPQSSKVTKTVDDIDEPIVKLDGLPANVSKNQIVDFFFGLDCKTVQIVRKPKGDCNGEAFIQFGDLETTVRALEKNGEPLEAGSRDASEVEVVASSLCEWRKEPKVKMEAPTSAPSKRKVIDHSSYSSSRHNDSYGSSRHNDSYGNSRNNDSYSHDRSYYDREFLVNMVGLPFTANEDDVRHFFSPIKITRVDLVRGNGGQLRGMAVVGFYSDFDRLEALKRDKCSMGSRYINLYIRDDPRQEPPLRLKRDRSRSPMGDRYRQRSTYRNVRR